MQYCRPFLHRKDGLLSRKIISLQSVFTCQSFPISKYSTNLISFFSLFSRTLFGRKIKVLQMLFLVRKSICYLFLRSNKTESGEKNRPQSRSNQSFFLSITKKHHSVRTLNLHWQLKVSTKGISFDGKSGSKSSSSSKE